VIEYFYYVSVTRDSDQKTFWDHEVNVACDQALGVFSAPRLHLGISGGILVEPYKIRGNTTEEENLHAPRQVSALWGLEGKEGIQALYGIGGGIILKHF
jgi:hypothetical protein